MLVALISQKDKEVKSFWEGRGEGKLLGEKERYCCNLLRSMCSKSWFLLSPFVHFQSRIKANGCSILLITWWR